MVPAPPQALTETWCPPSSGIYPISRPLGLQILQPFVGRQTILGRATCKGAEVCRVQGQLNGAQQQQSTRHSRQARPVQPLGG